MKPGPGCYSQTIYFAKAAPMFSIGKQERPAMSRTKHQFSPGPAAYRGDKNSIGNGSPKKSISHHLADIDKNNRDKLVPGPGSYEELHINVKRTAPKHRIGTS